MTTHDDFRTDEELEELGFQRVNNRVYSKAKGHKELVSDDGTTQVYRWVSDE